MSEWTYIWMAYGLTWATITIYLIYLVRRSQAAAATWHRAAGAGGGER